MELILGKAGSGKSNFMLMKVLTSNNSLYMSHEHDISELLNNGLFNVERFKRLNIKHYGHVGVVRTLNDLRNLILKYEELDNFYFDGCLDVEKIGVQNINELCSKYNKKILSTHQLNSSGKYDLMVESIR